MDTTPKPQSPARPPQWQVVRPLSYASAAVIVAPWLFIIFAVNYAGTLGPATIALLPFLYVSYGGIMLGCLLAVLNIMCTLWVATRKESPTPYKITALVLCLLSIAHLVASVMLFPTLWG